MLPPEAYTYTIIAAAFSIVNFILLLILMMTGPRKEDDRPIVVKFNDSKDGMIFTSLEPLPFRNNETQEEYNARSRQYLELVAQTLKARMS
jgi:hypothetical protein